jgi:hypothetical protein
MPVARKVWQPILACWAARVLPGGNPMLTAKGGASSPAGQFFGVFPGRSRSLLHIRPYSTQLARSNTGNRMKTLTVKDAKYFLGRLIDLARAFGGSGVMNASASCRLRGVDYV